MLALKIPTPQDESMVLQDTVTKTADYNTAGFDLGAGFQPGGLGMPAAAVVDVSALDLADTDETYEFVLEESDNNSVFVPAGAPVAVTATGVVAVKGFLTKRYVRLSLDVDGTTPSITFKAYLNTLVQR